MNEWTRIFEGHYAIQPNECWLWTRADLGNGYGAIQYKGDMWTAHRLSKQLSTGSVIPKPLVVMHLCHNRKCINPAHLQVGTHSENHLMKPRVTHCRKGHPLSGSNLYTHPLTGEHICRECKREYMRNYMRKRRRE